jgi:uncharacterized membrane protein
MPFAIVVLIGALFFWLPRLTRPDLYFAVTVPLGFCDSDEGRATLRRYRIQTLLCSTLALAVVLAAGERWPGVLVAAVLIQEAGSFVAYLSCRHRVLPHAVEPVAVREATLLTRAARLPGGWVAQAGPFVLLSAAALYLNQHWDGIPAGFPIHWGLDGQPNGWASRTPAGVYGPLAMGAMICLMIAGLGYATLRWSRPIRIGGAPGEAERHFQRTVVRVLVATEYLMAVIFAGSSLLPLTSGPPPLSLVLALPLLFAVVVIAVLVRQGQGGSRRTQGAEETHEGVRPVGDRTADRSWKVGWFYVNRDDPALFIEKRFGVGYTLNFGRPGSWIIVATLVLIPLLIGLVLKAGAK